MSLRCVALCVLSVLLRTPPLAKAALGNHSSLSAPSSYHVLPVFVQAPTPFADVHLFRPVLMRSSLPSSLRTLLLPPSDGWRSAMEPGRNPRGVQVWCGSGKLSVRITRRLLGFRAPSSLLFLGTCGVTRSTKRFHYFHYELNECGTERAMINGRLVYSNVLRYSPVPDTPVMRAIPVSLPIKCVYNRFHYIYKVGYFATANKRTFLKRLERKRTFSLTAYNARWKKLLPNEGFLLGEPIYFEASTAFLPNNKRVFINSCYVSPSKKPDSKPKMDVINNYGCMVDSTRRRSRSKFLSSRRNALRFAIDAFVFPKTSKRLYLHCSVTVGDRSASQSTKSCNFNRKTKRWEELHPSSSYVCSCCAAVCPRSDFETSILPQTFSTIVSRGSWTAVGDKLTEMIPGKGDTGGQSVPGVAAGGLPAYVLHAGELPPELVQAEPLEWQEDWQEEDSEEE